MLTHARSFMVFVAVLLVASLVGVGGLVRPTPASAIAASQKVALVPSASGSALNGGTMPTTGFPGGYAPVFTDVSLASIRDDAVDPLTGFDTVALLQVCEIGTFLSNSQFNARITGFVNGGGKLIIWDSECETTDYSGFLFPFATNNPGAAGAQGTLSVAENDDLASADPTSPKYINAELVATDTDAVGDANVFTTKSSAWCTSMTGTNVNGVNGPLHNYARSGNGLVIYSGLDMDEIDEQTSFDPASTTGADHLARIWLNELQLAGFTNLPCSLKTFGITLVPDGAQAAVGTTQVFTAHVVDNAAPVPNSQVTFTVTSGPNAGRTQVVATNANGDATFTLTSSVPGTDLVTASATISGTPVSDPGDVTWVGAATTTTTTEVTTTTTTAVAPAATPARFVAVSPAFTG
jgi:hypothetical protein